MREIASLASSLSALSARDASASRPRFAWPSQPSGDRLAMSAGLISLAGHPILDTLSDERRRRLHVLEAVQFFSLNIGGERELMAGLAVRLASAPYAGVSEYLGHFLDEEGAHTAVFVEFCARYGGRVYPDRQLRLARPMLPGEEEVLFFARVLVFEEIVHHVNRAVAADDDVWSLARAIHAYHAHDEARHIAFGRRLLVDLWGRHALAWPAEERARVGAYLEAYVRLVLRSLANPAVYRDAGIEGDLLAIREEALASPARAAFDEEATRPIRALFARLGIEGSDAQAPAAERAGRIS